MPTPHLSSRLAALLSLLISTGGCDDQGALSWVVSFADADLRAQVIVVSLEVREGTCEGVGSTVYTAVGRRGEMSPGALSLPSGRYAFSAYARDATCLQIASRCVDVEIPASSATVELVLQPMAPLDACGSDESCVDGLCSAGMADGGVADGCVPALEECNGVDDDCDGSSDEDFDLQTDLMHCGACETPCTVPTGSPECRGGTCQVACPAGTADCNGDPGDGCETDTDASVDHCGECDRACGTGVACMGGACADEVVDIAAGDGFTCAAMREGTVACWGRNDAQQLASSTLPASGRPVLIPGLGPANLVAANGRHACARESLGTLRCWGWGRSGELGDGTAENRSTPVAVTSISDSLALAAGRASTCAVVGDGSARCWGENADGQLGDGTTSDRNAPVRVAVLTGATAIDLGDAHACALQSRGAVRCWGDNEHGQVGDGRSGTDATAAREVVGITTAVTVATGGGHACTSLDDGTVQCWGRGSEGQLGDGSTRGSDTAIAAINVIDAESVGAGGVHTCAVRSGGTVACWGDNAMGQLGDGTVDRRVRATAATGVDQAVKVVGGSAHTCALTRRGGVQCWGDNSSGEIGIGHMLAATVLTPRDVAGLRGAVQLVSGAEHACARRLSRQVLCWGSNSSGQVGDGAMGTDRTSPAVVADVAATTLALGADHSCAILDDATLSCWGENGEGQLGLGTTANSDVPTPVAGLSTVTAIGAGLSHTCAVHGASARVSCWGENADGQVGDGTTIRRSAPADASGLANVAMLGLGARHSCAVTTTGAVLCWGDNSFGQLGIGSFSPRSAPTSVPGLSSEIQLATGGDFTCALRSDGTVRCFGDNTRGQIGIGTTGAGVDTPTRVMGLDDATAISAGVAHACAARAGGTVVCWGAGGGGQLGDGDVMDRSAPVETSPAIDQAIGVAAGADHACARLASGSVQCWGLNRAGQLGDGTTTPRPAPTFTLGLP